MAERGNLVTNSMTWGEFHKWKNEKLTVMRFEREAPHKRLSTYSNIGAIEAIRESILGISIGNLIMMVPSAWTDDDTPSNYEIAYQEIKKHEKAGRKIGRGL